MSKTYKWNVKACVEADDRQIDMWVAGLMGWSNIQSNGESRLIGTGKDGPRLVPAYTRNTAEANHVVEALVTKGLVNAETYCRVLRELIVGDEDSYIHCPLISVVLASARLRCVALLVSLHLEEIKKAEQPTLPGM